MKNAYDYLNDVKMDFSIYEEKERYTMKHMSGKRIALVAACVAVFAVSTVFATGVVENVVKKVSTGHNAFYQLNPTDAEPLPDGLVGKIFDKDGNILNSLTRADVGNIYDKDGNKITGEMFAKMYEEVTGNPVMVSDGKKAEASKVFYETPEEAEQGASFDVKTPAYMPQGFAFSEAYAFKDADGTVSGDYRNLVYKNQSGKEIFIYERLLNEETAFETGTSGTLEELTINGRKAVIMDDTSLNLETEDGVSVGIYGKGNITRDELVKIAESIR